MLQWQALHQFDEVAQKWRDLAERRHADYADLYQSGRWKQYYDEGKFLYLMREAVRLAELWAKIAPRPGDVICAPATQVEPETIPPRRTAA
jgi:hypothetical protein